MAQISLCMIVRNEHDTLARCLDSVREAVDEIIIVDTGSQDDTREIARRYTDQVIDYVWQDDFSAARNAAFAHASCDFTMWMDADDVLDDAAALTGFKETELDQYDVVMAPYHAAFDGNGKPTFTYYRERILRTGMGFLWEGAVHEAITPRGRIGYAGFSVRHEKEPSAARDPQRNLRIYEGLRARGKTFCARERFYYGRELRAAGRLEEPLSSFRFIWIRTKVSDPLGSRTTLLT